MRSPRRRVRSRDVLASMHECRDLRALALVASERVGLDHRPGILERIARLVSKCGRVFEARGDVSFEPRNEERFDVREAVGKGRATDAEPLDGPRHRHRPVPVAAHVAAEAERRP